MSSPVQCGYVGLGAMGKNMAGHIANKLSSLNYPPLLVYNRTRARTEELNQTHPIQIADNLQQLGACDIIFTCLLNDTVVIETVNTLKPLLKPGSIFVESSTIDPAVAKDLAQQLKQVGVYYLACPIMGPPAQAAAAQLTLLMAGGETKAIREQVISILVPTIGPKLIELDLHDVTASLKLKLCGNFFVTSIIETLGEGMTLGEASGIGQASVKQLIDCVFPNSLLGAYAGRMLNNTYRDEINFNISGIKKDVGHILKLAKESNASLPITELFLENANKVQQEQGDLGISSIVGISRQKAGLGFDLENKK